MRMYLMLKERAAGFRADPRVQAAQERAKVTELAKPTLNEGESLADLVADRSAFEDFDADVKGAYGYGNVALAQLAIDHLLGFGA
jgi:xylose isomerase